MLYRFCYADRIIFLYLNQNGQIVYMLVKFTCVGNNQIALTYLRSLIVTFRGCSFVSPQRSDD